MAAVGGWAGVTAESHRAAIRDVATEYGLKQPFVKAVAPTRAERRKITLAHALAGKPPGKTGRTLCGLCGCRLSDSACERFRTEIERSVGRILDEYIDVFCPQCKSKIEGFQPVRIVTGSPDFEPTTSADPAPPEPVTFEMEQKTEVQPCGCRLDEPRKLGTVDRDALDTDARSGDVVSGYEGKATRGTDPLLEAVPE